MENLGTPASKRRSRDVSKHFSVIRSPWVLDPVHLAARPGDNSNDGLRFEGNVPSESPAREALRQSGFFDDVSSRLKGTSVGTDGHIVTESETKVDPVVASKLIWGIWGSRPDPEAMAASYEVLIEAMQNTHNHADRAGGVARMRWKAGAQLLSPETAVFCFVDLGVGILNRGRGLNALSQAILTACSSLFGHFGGDAITNWHADVVFSNERYWLQSDVLAASVARGLQPGASGAHLSRTGQPERGNGLPSMARQVLEHRNFDRLCIMSHGADVSIDLNSGIEAHRKLRPFPGTILAWNVTLRTAVDDRIDYVGE